MAKNEPTPDTPVEIDALTVYRWMGKIDETLLNHTSLLVSVAAQERHQNKRITSLETSRTRIKAGWATTTFLIMIAFGLLQAKLSGLLSSLAHWTNSGPHNP